MDRNMNNTLIWSFILLIILLYLCSFLSVFSSKLEIISVWIGTVETENFTNQSDIKNHIFCSIPFESGNLVYSFLREIFCGDITKDVKTWFNTRAYSTESSRPLKIGKRQSFKPVENKLTIQILMRLLHQLLQERKMFKGSNERKNLLRQNARVA